MDNPIQQLVDAARAYLQRETAERGFTLTAAILAVESAQVETRWVASLQDEEMGLKDEQTALDYVAACKNPEIKVTRIDTYITTYRSVESDQK